MTAVTRHAESWFALPMQTQDTRSTLLTKAEAIVRGRGYSGFSYADLADAVGIRKASIHHHFRTKTDLALALLEAYSARYADALDGILAESHDGVARILAYSDLYLGGVEQGLGCLCAALASEHDTLPPQLRENLGRFFAEHIGWLTRVLEDGRANGTVRAEVEPASHARMIVATLEGALMMERFVDGPTGFRDTMSALQQGLRPA